jgi:SAM-dependent methyltransferase
MELVRSFVRMLGRTWSRRFGRRPNALEYWRDRADRLGKRSVVNVKYGPEEIERATQEQKAAIFPLLRSWLRGDETVALDFGCGYGRFTGELAQAIGGRAVGVDPIARLLSLAPPHARVEYLLLGEDGRIPLDATSVDVLFTCLVLGGIVQNDALDRTVSEFRRVGKPGALIFLVENTSSRPDREFWIYRTVKEYCQRFAFADLQPIGGYAEVDNTITIFAGRISA